jgi:ABC-type transporter Mla MlaB component
MLKVRKSVDMGRTTFVLSGRIEQLHLTELEELIEADAHLADRAIDLGEVKLVDREAVAFLAACEAAGIELKNCPSYVRVWIDTRSDAPNEK